LLIPLKPRIHELPIRELMEYSVFPDPDVLEQTIAAYESDKKLELYGYESEGEIIGIMGFQMNESGTLRIDHIAVRPDSRGAGFGRGLILEAIELFNPSVVRVEVDEETVEFYRRIGFEIESLGEQVPGIERFACSYRTEIDQ
jgi:ribosomal protein S18 acetylase RimI-like enzyme